MMSEGDKWRATGFFLFVALVIAINIHRSHQARKCRKCASPFSGRKVSASTSVGSTSHGYALHADRGWHRTTTRSWTETTIYRCKKCGAEWGHSEERSKTRRR